MQDSGSGNTPLSPIEGQDKQAPLPPTGQSGAAQSIGNTSASGQTSSVADQVPDLPPITWTASSSISPQRSKKWYQIAAAIFSLALVFVIIMVAIKRMELVSAITIAVLLIVMYIALVSSAKLPSRVVKYTISGKGIDINDKLHPYSEFHSFGVRRSDKLWQLVLIPNRQFGMEVTPYISETDGEKIVDMLANFLPMEEVPERGIDKLIRYLKL